MGHNAALWTHEPPGYDCPFLGVQNERNRASDAIAVTELAYALISPKWWPGNADAALASPGCTFTTPRRRTWTRKLASRSPIVAAEIGLPRTFTG
jgi:hypothetical protein